MSLATVSYSLRRIGNTVEVAVATALPDVVAYHWYLDGRYVGKTAGPTRTFCLAAEEQLRLEVVATDDPDFDPIAAAPDGYPATRTLWWIRSHAADVAAYRVEQQQDGGAWIVLATAPADASWDYAMQTDPLEDLAIYAWRIVPIDAAGNDGTPIVIGPERIVRTPDAPDFSATFDSETETVAFAEIA